MKRLKEQLQAIDRKSYPAYKGLKGSYQFGGYRLIIEHVQGDPFASPSRLSVVLSREQAGFPQEYFEQKHRRIALEDHLLRLFHKQINKFNFKANGSGKSGLIAICSCGQEVLERSACHVNEKNGLVTIHFSVGFPANGRCINARELEKILYQFLPKCVEQTLVYGNIDAKCLEEAIYLADDQRFIREKMKEEDIVAFVANGSILPRESGVSQRPMKDAIPFQSPRTMEVTWELPHKGTCTGMAIRKGVTLIVGGGYHGKSTLLQALQWAVYPHILGDGREYIVTNPTAFKIRAEDGRSICNTDISLFIRRVRALYKQKDVSTILVAGSCGAFFHIADTILQMDGYEPYDITLQAKEAAKAFPLNFNCEEPLDWEEKERFVTFHEKSERNTRSSKIKTMGRDGFILNKQNVDLRYLEQIADGTQMTGIGKLLDYVQDKYQGKKVSVQKVAEETTELLENKGFSGVIKGSELLDMAMPRKCEICGCINRYIRENK